MSSGGDLESRLSNSDAVNSLRAEQEVVAEFVRRGWLVTHGHYYPDPTTGKQRELDVRARKGFHRELQSRTQFAGINVYAEVKTLRDYHLVFAPLVSFYNLEGLDHSWLGNDEAEIADALTSRLSTGELKRILRTFRRCYVTREGMLVIHALHATPPPSHFSSSAFRETSIGADREPDTSVLWRATQTVLGAIGATKRQETAGRIDDVAGIASFRMRSREEVIASVESEMRKLLNRIELYHAVVVIDSTLWAADISGLRRLPWCRLFQLGNEYPAPWCDVVQRSNLSNYISEISNYYERTMRKVRAYINPA